MKSMPLYAREQIRRLHNHRKVETWEALSFRRHLENI